MIQMANYHCSKNKSLRNTDFEHLVDYMLGIHFRDSILSTMHM